MFVEPVTSNNGLFYLTFKANVTSLVLNTDLVATDATCAVCQNEFQHTHTKKKQANHIYNQSKSNFGSLGLYVGNKYNSMSNQILFLNAIYYEFIA